MKSHCATMHAPTIHQRRWSANDATRRNRALAIEASSEGCGSAALARMRGDAVAVPRDRAPEALCKRRARAEAEQLLCPGGVELAARLAVRHRRVPDDLALESGQVGDRLGQIADRRLDAGAEVDGVGAV